MGATMNPMTDRRDGDVRRAGDVRQFKARTFKPMLDGYSFSPVVFLGPIAKVLEWHLWIIM